MISDAANLVMGVITSLGADAYEFAEVAAIHCLRQGARLHP